jgi:hypothetical protein
VVRPELVIEDEDSVVPFHVRLADPAKTPEELN